ncbi:hypothetical protein NDU88_003023 [Pleurodeles waltl]|uniref:Uncharacterized protein n=1 Tax=Pleurodeles waltl TaxID=8319 RepID=A0AAV7PFQ9_PLEWA|nr:hypothetical protein NDU88_003023 [Pleurodeles waltl]
MVGFPNTYLRDAETGNDRHNWEPRYPASRQCKKRQCSTRAARVDNKGRRGRRRGRRRKKGDVPRTNAERGTDERWSTRYCYGTGRSQRARTLPRPRRDVAKVNALTALKAETGKRSLRGTTLRQETRTKEDALTQRA